MKSIKLSFEHLIKIMLKFMVKIENNNKNKISQLNCLTFPF